MQCILRSRRGGKTYSLFELLEENPDSIIVCPTYVMAEFTRADAEMYAHERRIYWSREYLVIHIIPWEPIERLKGRCGPILIDNVDVLLGLLTGHQVQTITATGVIQ